LPCSLGAGLPKQMPRRNITPYWSGLNNDYDRLRDRFSCGGLQ
jgi:hypothetical protein